MAGERKPGVPSDEEPTVVRAAGSVGAHSCGSPPEPAASRWRRLAGRRPRPRQASRRGPKPAEAPKPTAAAPRKRPKRRSLTRPSRPRHRPPRPGEITKGGSLRVGVLGDPRGGYHSAVAGEVFVCHNIYDPLITFDEQLNPRPGWSSRGRPRTRRR